MAKTNKDTFLKFMDLVVEVTDPEYQQLMQNVREYYVEKSSLSMKQKSLVENAVKYRMLNV